MIQLCVYIIHLCFKCTDVFSGIVDTVKRICLILADVVVVLVTVWRTYGEVKANRAVNVRTTFAPMLFRAGEIIMTMMNLSMLIPTVCIGILYFGYVEFRTSACDTL